MQQIYRGGGWAEGGGDSGVSNTGGREASVSGWVSERKG